MRMCMKLSITELFDELRFSGALQAQKGKEQVALRGTPFRNVELWSNVKASHSRAASSKVGAPSLAPQDHFLSLMPS